MNACAAFTLALLASSGVVSATDTVTIDFESFPGPDGELGTADDVPTQPGDTISNQYCGLVFSLADGRSPVIDTAPAGTALPGSPRAVYPVNADHFGAPVNQDFFQHLIIDFDIPASRVRILALDSDEAVTMRAFNGSGVELDSDSRDCPAECANMSVADLEVMADGAQGRIKRVVIELTTGVQAPGNGPEFYDALEYDVAESGCPCVTTEVQKLLSPSGMASDSFGSALSRDGDVLVVGAAGADSSAGAAYVYRFDGVDWGFEETLLASDGNARDAFGNSVSVSGNVAVVGAPGAGKAYVYRFDGTWGSGSLLEPSDGQPNARFGDGVAASGDAVLVGAPQQDGAGAAYVFRFDGMSWTEEEKLLPFHPSSDPAADDDFGLLVSLSGDTAVVGAHGHTHDHTVGGVVAEGAAFVFRHDGTSWVGEDELRASDALTDDAFGIDVSVSGDLIAVGARFDDAANPGDTACESGAAYVFRRDGNSWEEEQKLTASDGECGDWLGRNLTTDGHSILVGAWLDNDNGENSGSAYLFRFDGVAWVEEANLLASDGAPQDRLGISLAIQGNTAIVGAPGDDDNGVDSGSAYVIDLGPAFDRPTPCSELIVTAVGEPVSFDVVASGCNPVGWLELLGNALPEGASMDPALPMNGNPVSSTFRWTPGNEAIGAHVLEFRVMDDEQRETTCTITIEVVGCTTNGGNYCVGGTNSDGEAASMSVQGSTSVAANDLTLVATDIASASRFGLFVFGDTQAQIPFQDGFLCIDLAGSFHRLNPILTYSNQNEVTRPVDLSAVPANIITAGSIWHFQFWYRDFGLTNLSDAITLCFAP